MLHRLLADGVMATHFGYLVYLVVGGFLAWRWPRARPCPTSPST